MNQYQGRIEEFSTGGGGGLNFFVCFGGGSAPLWM